MVRISNLIHFLYHFSLLPLLHYPQSSCVIQLFRVLGRREWKGHQDIFLRGKGGRLLFPPRTKSGCVDQGAIQFVKTTFLFLHKVQESCFQLCFSIK